MSNDNPEKPIVETLGFIMKEMVRHKDDIMVRFVSLLIDLEQKGIITKERAIELATAKPETLFPQNQK